MPHTQATRAIAEATRRALEDLDTYPDNAELRGAILLLDVITPDPDDTTEKLSHLIWNTEPMLSTAHAHGICSMAAHEILAPDTDD